jgi:hypothetical protein
MRGCPLEKLKARIGRASNSRWVTVSVYALVVGSYDLGSLNLRTGSARRSHNSTPSKYASTTVVTSIIFSGKLRLGKVLGTGLVEAASELSVRVSKPYLELAFAVDDVSLRTSFLQSK